jgi:ketosteroid isomerase-like protein
LTYDLQKEIINPNESLVLDYFQRVKSGDLSGLLSLFSDDSIIYEPFSKSKYVTGKSDIESFLRTVIMANAGMRQEIKIGKREMKARANENRVVVLVTFHKGGSITGRFTFEFVRSGGLDKGKIKILIIEFTY